MKKTVLRFVETALILICFTLSVYADDTINYSKTMTETGIKITGQVLENTDEEILLRVLKYTDDSIDLDSDLVYIQQQSVDTDGKFEFYCELPDGGNVSDGEFFPEKYIVNLGALKLGTQVSEVVDYYGREYRDYVIGKINEAKSTNSTALLSTVMTETYEKLSINAEVYDEYILDGGSFERLAQRLASLPQISNLQEYALQLNQSAAFQMLMNFSDSDKENPVRFISDEKYQKYLGIENSSAINTFNLLKASYGDIIGLSYKKLIEQGELNNAFEFSVISVGLRYAVSYGDVANILKDNENILGITYSQYNLTNSELLKLAGVNIKALSDVKPLIDAIISGRYISSGSGTPGGRPGGTSGGGGSGGSSVGAGFMTGSTGASQNSEYETLINPFTDLYGYEWAEKSIVDLYKNGIVNGKSSESFDPGAAVTREEFIKIIVSAFGIKATVENEPCFKDVKADEWYFPFVKTAFNTGIVMGDESGMFGVGAPIKRQDIAVILKRMYFSDMKLESLNENIFSDFTSISDYAKESVEIMQNMGIMNGFENKCFMPQANATRAETAVLVARVMELVKSGGVSLND